MNGKLPFTDILGRQIGAGGEKRCFLNALNNKRCIKISNKRNCVQIRREIEYFSFIKNKNIVASFVPEFYRVLETSEWIGYEQECILGREKGGVYLQACPLGEFISNPNNDENLIRRELLNLKEEMYSKNVICCDLNEYNVIRAQDENGSRLIVIDGFGAPEFIPICKYVKFFGRKKIERQWRRFELRLKPYFLHRQDLQVKNN